MTAKPRRTSGHDREDARNIGKRPQSLTWPHGALAAVSLTFDDARVSQVDAGLPVLDRYGIRATFYVSVGSALRERLAQWKQAKANGHEIGNHTMTHPCTGNYPWTRGNALEDFWLERMECELDEASLRIERMFGEKPLTFAYPCGQTFVGRGRRARSYVPLVARRFLVGRGWGGTTPHDPARGDLAQAWSIAMDGKTFTQLRAEIERAATRGAWLILVGHEVGRRGDTPYHTTSRHTLARLCRHLRDARQELWVDTVAAVGAFIEAGQPAVR
ncbi:MAG: hypothetical protein BIFFINMI_02031 [Phycisphaerae bacterium]|nr:hypothetical protein [Phycisphaerae bacterium]